MRQDHKRIRFIFSWISSPIHPSYSILPEPSTPISHLSLLAILTIWLHIGIGFFTISIILLILLPFLIFLMFSFLSKNLLPGPRLSTPLWITATETTPPFVYINTSNIFYYFNTFHLILPWIFASTFHYYYYVTWYTSLYRPRTNIKVSNQTVFQLHFKWICYNCRSWLQLLMLSSCRWPKRSSSKQI